MKSIESTLKIGLWLLVALALASLMIYFPSHSDEFTKYQRLVCFQFDGSVFSTLQSGCDKYPASFLGFQYHKSYDYYGVTSNFLYAPLYYLLPNIYSHYLFGFISLLIFSGLMTKALQVDLKLAVIPCLFFPFLYSFVHDIGPISLAMICYPILIMATARFLDSKQTLKNYLLWLAISFSATLFALEDKAFLVYLLPPIAIISFALAIYQGQGNSTAIEFIKEKAVPSILMKLTFFGLAIAVALFTILFLIRIDGMSYYHYLKEMRNIFVREVQIPRWEIFYSLFDYLITPILMVHRTIAPNEFAKMVSRVLFAPLLAILFIYLWRSKRASLWVLLLSNVVLGAIYTYSQNVWASHHYIFLLVPILILLMQVANSSRQMFWLIIFLLVINLGVNIALAMNSRIISHASPSRKVVFEYLTLPDIAQKSVINFSTMGGYSIQALYGNANQVVTWTSLRVPTAGKSLLEILEKSNRQVILNVCDSEDFCNYEQVRAQFPNQEIKKVGPANSSWWVWEITPKSPDARAP